MASIFPGMDPFIEGSRWTDFHTRFIVALSDELLPKLGLEYGIRVEERVYVEHAEEDERLIRPDLAILRNANEPTQPAPQSVASQLSTAVLEPVERTLPKAPKTAEKYLVVYDVSTEKVVTIIELLSPSNKRRGSSGRVEYLDKRESILNSPTNLVELDLLRGGARLPTVESLPLGDYYAFISRATNRPKVDVYAWPLAHRLPVIPVPLDDRQEASVDLQVVFDLVFDRSRYAMSIHYEAPIDPPFSKSDASWASELLKSRR